MLRNWFIWLQISCLFGFSINILNKWTFGIVDFSILFFTKLYQIKLSEVLRYPSKKKLIKNFVALLGASKTDSYIIISIYGFCFFMGYILIFHFISCIYRIKLLLLTNRFTMYNFIFDLSLFCACESGLCCKEKIRRCFMGKSCNAAILNTLAEIKMPQM